MPCHRLSVKRLTLYIQLNPRKGFKFFEKILNKLKISPPLHQDSDEVSIFSLYSYSQVKILECSGVSEKVLDFFQLLRIEQGKCFVPDYEIIAIANYFRVSMDYLSGISNEKQVALSLQTFDRYRLFLF